MKTVHPATAPVFPAKLPASGFWPLTLGCFLLASALASAATPAISSTISAATVYTDRAVVTRNAHLDLPAGPSQLTFEQLPAGLVEASLQVNGHGPANATILDVAARIVHSIDTANPDEKKIEDEIEDLRQRDRILADKVQLLTRQTALLAQIEAAATRLPAPPPPAKDGSPASPPPTFEEWQKLLDFSAGQTKNLAETQRGLDRDRELLAAKIDAANSRLNDLRGQRTGGKATTTVTVRLTAATAGALDLALMYAVPNAGWSPVYDARLRTSSHELELGYFGLVHNGTGEDWKNISLTLSTARPALGGGVAEPSAWILDVVQPMVVPAVSAGAPAINGLRGGQGGRGGLTQAGAGTLTLTGTNNYVGGVELLKSAATFGLAGNNLVSAPEGNDGLFDSADRQLAYQGASLQTGATSATFKIDARTSLASDNTPQRVAINSQQLKANLQYQAMPRATETVYLTAYANNGSEFPLLAGALNVFLDDNFVATSSLPTVMPAERFHLALGADEGITLKRRTIPRFNEDSGITGKYRLVTYEYLVTINNHKNTTERVMFKDVLPVSRDERIVVKLATPAERDLLKPESIVVPGGLPKPGITKEEDGKIVWRADLAPGEKREFPLKFTVEYPADVSVTGLQ